jgi:hypothetical protein
VPRLIAATEIAVSPLRLVEHDELAVVAVRAGVSARASVTLSAPLGRRLAAAGSRPGWSTVPIVPATPPVFGDLAPLADPDEVDGVHRDSLAGAGHGGDEAAPAGAAVGAPIAAWPPAAMSWISALIPGAAKQTG